MKRFAGIALALALAVALPVPIAAAGKRGITERDILKFRWVADPEISPDGGRVAYVLVTVNEKAPGGSSRGATATSGRCR